MKKDTLVNENEDPQNLDPAVCFKSILKMADTLDILTGKWRIPIIISLSFGPKRFTVLSKELKKITDRTLSKELKFLEENLLVIRNTIDGYPPVTEYQITEHGMSLTKVLNNLKKWGDLHREKIIHGDRESKSSE